MATKPASLKPVVHQKLELDLDEGATRVHKFPKELIHRLREQESAKSSSPPPDDRTAVFRAPPELLARAMRARLSAQANEEPARASEAPKVNDLPTKPPPADADDQIADSGVQYLTENTSGISLRPAGVGSFAAVPASRSALSEALGEQPTVEADTQVEVSAEVSDDDWNLPESAIEDPTLIRSEGLPLPTLEELRRRPVDESPPISLVDSDPITEALLNTDVDALLAPAAPPAFALAGQAPEPPVAAVSEPELADRAPSVRPEFRRPMAKRVLVAAVVVAAAVAAFVRFGLTLN